MNTFGIPFQLGQEENDMSIITWWTGLDDIMDRSMRDLVAWWKHKRPLNFKEADHLKNPTINCTTNAEKKLARRVAEYIEYTKNAEYYDSWR